MTCVMTRRGFTLVEVLVVMSILTILAAVAIPNYMAYVQRSNRAEARGRLVEATVWLERFRTETGTYAGAVLPVGLQQTPPVPQVPRYTFALGGLGATTYTLTATPVGSMAGDVCGNLTVNQFGQRAFTGGGGTLAVCWNR